MMPPKYKIESYAVGVVGATCAGAGAGDPGLPVL